MRCQYLDLHGVSVTQSGQPQPFMPASAVFSQYNMTDPTFGGPGMNPMFPMISQNQLANQGMHLTAALPMGGSRLTSYHVQLLHVKTGMMNPYGSAVGSPVPLNQVMMNQGGSSQVTGYGQGIECLSESGCACVLLHSCGAEKFVCGGGCPRASCST